MELRRARIVPANLLEIFRKKFLFFNAPQLARRGPLRSAPRSYSIHPPLTVSTCPVT
jgi:hypothetical protein